MDVTFPRVVDSVRTDPYILLQQMMECQNGLNSEYADKLNDKIDDRKNELQEYLNRNHPGMAVPQDGPHFQFVKNTMEEIATLSMELKDANEMFTRYRTLAFELQIKLGDYMNTTTTVKDSSMTVKDKKDILERLRDSLGTMAQIRLNYERQSQRVSLGYQKFMDMAKKTTDPVSGPEDDDDAFLGILRKGILHPFEVDRSCYESIVELMTMWGRGSDSILKRMEEMQLESLSGQLKLLELEEPEGVAGQDGAFGGHGLQR